MHSLALITFAVAHEARLFRPKIRKQAGFQVILTGVGQTNAARAIREALKSKPRLVITSGYAGALDPLLPVGTVVYDGDNDLELLKSLPPLGARKVQFYCAHRVVSKAADKNALRQKTGAHAVEMESAVIRSACRSAGVPSLTVRVISDAADEDFPLDFDRCMTPTFEISYGKLFWNLLTSPQRIPRLIAFRNRLNPARRQLTETLLKIVDHPLTQAVQAFD